MISDTGGIEVNECCNLVVADEFGRDHLLLSYPQLSSPDELRYSLYPPIQKSVEQFTILKIRVFLPKLGFLKFRLFQLFKKSERWVKDCTVY